MQRTPMVQHTPHTGPAARCPVLLWRSVEVAAHQQRQAARYNTRCGARGRGQQEAGVGSLPGLTSTAAEDSAAPPPPQAAGLSAAVV